MFAKYSFLPYDNFNGRKEYNKLCLKNSIPLNMFENWVWKLPTKELKVEDIRSMYTTNIELTVPAFGMFVLLVVSKWVSTHYKEDRIKLMDNRYFLDYRINNASLYSINKDIYDEILKNEPEGTSKWYDLTVVYARLLFDLQFVIKDEFNDLQQYRVRIL